MRDNYDNSDIKRKEEMLKMQTSFDETKRIKKRNKINKNIKRYSNIFVLILSIGVSIFNYIFDPLSVFGIFTMFTSFLFIGLWFNYITFRLTRKDMPIIIIKLCKVYFFLILLSCIYSIINHNNIMPDEMVVITKIASTLMLPLSGLRCVLRLDVIYYITSLIVVSFINIILSIMSAKDDNIDELYNENKLESDNKENF